MLISPLFPFFVLVILGNKTQGKEKYLLCVAIKSTTQANDLQKPLLNLWEKNRCYSLEIFWCSQFEILTPNTKMLSWPFGLHFVMFCFFKKWFKYEPPQKLLKIIKVSSRWSQSTWYTISKYINIWLRHQIYRVLSWMDPLF